MDGAISKANISHQGSPKTTTQYTQALEASTQAAGSQIPSSASAPATFNTETLPKSLSKSSVNDKPMVGSYEESTEHSVTNASVLNGAPLQVKTRRRRGSLRKIALLSRGAERERKEDKDKLSEDLPHKQEPNAESLKKAKAEIEGESRLRHNALGLPLSRATPPELDDDYGVSRRVTMASQRYTNIQGDADPDRVASYNSTTDEDDVLQTVGSKPSMSVSTGSEAYFRGGPQHRRRSVQHTKSPLSYSGLSSTAISPAVSDWDYSETEWWGWVVLCVTWFVFVIGMGSCLDIWSWAWDVGKTPYAPPELENDPTLPIVGYYPTLIILTGVMAWVWVVVAWVGMKYFRHAKISGD